jgi:hypothetical protein
LPEEGLGRAVNDRLRRAAGWVDYVPHLRRSFENDLRYLPNFRTYGAFSPSDIWIYKTTAPRRIFVSMYKMMIESLREATVW